MKKELHVAIDFYDDIIFNGFYSQQQLSDLMAYCRSLGATTIEWIFDDMWSIYDDYPDGMDLLRTAVAAAHANELKFHVVYKPFEGKLDLFHLLPHTAPRPSGVPVWEDLRGLTPIIRPFAAEHPEMCMQRKAGDEDPGGAITSIRLIKKGDAPSGLRAEDLSLWVSEVNGTFTRYLGTFLLEETSEWRPVHPMGKTCRILTLSDLDIPEKFRYIEVRLADGVLTGEAETFCNDYDQIIELVISDYRIIPSSPAIVAPNTRKTPQHWAHQLSKRPFSQLVRYAQAPAARAFLEDGAAIDEQAAEMRHYGYFSFEQEYSLSETRRLAAARGKLPYKCGVLNPVYPEVRQSWLDVVQFCIDRGADGVDFRIGHHGQIQEYWLYGYNPPVVAALGEDAAFGEVQDFISKAYTEFLRQARDLLHSHGRQIGVHLFPNFLNIGDSKIGYPRKYQEYEWQLWVQEIADFAVFRGAMGLREETLHYVIDQFGSACREAEIPLIYQSNRRCVAGSGASLHLSPDNLRWLEHEWKYAMQHPNVHAYQLYETAYFTQLDEEGHFQGSEEMGRFAPKDNADEVR